MSNTTLDILGRRFDQVCFVVRDLDRAIEFFTRANGITVWNKAIDLARHQIDKEYYGQPGDFQFSCAYGYAGETLIELARHDGGKSVYGDWLDSGATGPHHIGFRQQDEAEYLQAEAHYLSMGLKKAMSGFFKGAHGNCRWAYFDTREFIGCFTELYYVDGENVKAMERLKRGENVSIAS